MFIILLISNSTFVTVFNQQHQFLDKNIQISKMALAFYLLEKEDTALSLMNQRVFRDRRNPQDSYNDTEFIRRYRITREFFWRYTVIPTTTQLAVAIQFMATGTFQTVIPTAHGGAPALVRLSISARQS